MRERWGDGWAEEGKASGEQCLCYIAWHNSQRTHEHDDTFNFMKTPKVAPVTIVTGQHHSGTSATGKVGEQFTLHSNCDHFCIHISSINRQLFMILSPGNCA